MSDTTNMLVQQFNKIWRHIRTGSYQTRRRYYAAMLRFIFFLGSAFHLLKLKNVSGHHLATYVETLQEQDLSPSYIKTELSAIRFVHDHIPDAKHPLPSNDELSVELEQRQFNDIDRAWSQSEFECMVAVMISLGFIAYACALNCTPKSGQELDP